MKAGQGRVREKITGQGRIQVIKILAGYRLQKYLNLQSSSFDLIS
jgi:hypothetical protein